MDTRRIYASIVSDIRNGRPLKRCPAADDLADDVDLFTKVPVIKHLLNCPDCLVEFGVTLRTVLSGPAFWESQGLSLRTANALARAGIMNWNDLAARIDEEIPGIGKISRSEIEKTLAAAVMLETVSQSDPEASDSV